MEGNVLRGRFVPPETLAVVDAPVSTDAKGAAELQWCDRRLLARINRRMLEGLRKEIEPATAADYLRFLFSWQHVRAGTALPGRGGLAQVIAQLQGCEIAAGAWEREVLPARVAGYDSAWLDGLCLSGELAWGRLAPREAALAPSRAAPIAIVRRRDLPWLLVAGDADPQGGDAGLSAPARDVLRFLRESGASFLDDIIQGAHRLRSEAEDALWELVSAGRVTGDGFAGLRALISATQSRGGARARWHARWTRRTGSPAGSGRWALLRAPQPPPEEDDLHEALARQYIKRYGVVFRDVLARETRAPAWRDLLRVYRRLEMRGELRGGRLVAGFVGEQFAAPEAVESMRAIRREPPRGELVRISACDPLNLVGIITPGPRVPATLANSVLFKDGVPQLSAEEAPVTRASLPGLESADLAN
jgi:ATP-dependent Lhr-like helicase